MRLSVVLLILGERLFRKIPNRNKANRGKSPPTPPPLCFPQKTWKNVT